MTASLSKLSTQSARMLERHRGPLQAQNFKLEDIKTDEASTSHVEANNKQTAFIIKIRKTSSSTTPNKRKTSS